MKVSHADLADRLSILNLKLQRLPFSAEIQREQRAYTFACTEEGIDWAWVHRLHEINSQIWDKESDIRRGKEGELGLEEVGRRALAIRDLNAQRIAIKNELAATVGGFQEIKVNHASEQTPALQA